MSWSFLIIGGSLLAILNNDFAKLEGNKQVFYVLFIFGWLLLGVSIYYGELVTRSYIASLFVDNKYLDKTTEKMSKRFDWQIFYFIFGFACFALWIVIFVILKYIFSI